MQTGIHQSDFTDQEVNPWPILCNRCAESKPSSSKCVHSMSPYRPPIAPNARSISARDSESSILRPPPDILFLVTIVCRRAVSKYREGDDKFATCRWRRPSTCIRKRWPLLHDASPNMAFSESIYQDRKVLDMLISMLILHIRRV